VSVRAKRKATRVGPRPLPLHLLSASGVWTSSHLASTLSRNGLVGWKPALAPAAARLESSLKDVPPEAFAAALNREIAARTASFLDGIERYRHHAYRRDLGLPPALIERGTTRLLDYRPEGGAPVLVVPSLINRAYVLDLLPESSLMRHLASAGLRPLLVDWGRPGDEERGFGLTDYIAGRLEAIATAAARETGRKLAVLGYCMGGLLAVALAQRRPDLVSGLVAMATPWDFHAERAAQARLMGTLVPALVQSFQPLGEVPVDVLQMFFLANDPLTAARKFIGLVAISAGSAAERRFVALEDWLNDGVPLALPVAEDVLGGWYGENLPGKGQWRVAGRPVIPEEIEVPGLVLVPRQDRIVPPLTAAALADHLIEATRIDPPLGHIGMVVGKAAPDAVWRPLAEWLKARAG
jgi:poly[(R)-3-hydroxyalkanoate] polymerase subunit PhaC